MDLSGQLHNLPKPVEYLLSLAVPAASEVSARIPTAWATKRRLGDVRDAMIAVLREEGECLPVAEIYRRVEQRVDGAVSYSHVRDYLNHRSRGEKPLFERTRHGVYGLVPAEGVNAGKRSPRKRPTCN
jgi:hypothetical protein